MTLLIAVTFLVAASFGSARAGESSVSPPVVNLRLAEGESATFQVAVDPGGAVASLDVLFVFDTTGSMDEEIDVAKEQGSALARDILRQAPETRFGVASFSDYRGEFDYPGYSGVYGEDDDYPWRVDQAMSPGADKVQSSIRTLAGFSGADEPEDYARVLYECANSGEIGWRDAGRSKRIVVLFGDAPPHDLDFGGGNTGGDPGRDGTSGTEDDLDFDAVVSGLAEHQTAVLAVNCGGDASAEAAFKFMSIQTNGQYADLHDPSGLRAKVLALVKRETRTIDRLVLQPQGRQAAWAKVAPAEISNASPDKPAVFTVTVTVPPGSAGVGTGDIRLAGLADGAGLGITQVNALVRDPKPTGFLPSRDGWGFVNRSSRADEEQFKSYFGVNQVVSSDGHWYYAARRSYDRDWPTAGDGGSCFGMAASAIAFQKRLDEIDTVPVGGTLVRAPAIPLDLPTKWFQHVSAARWIEDYQARQIDQRAQLSLGTQMGTTPADVLTGIREYLDAGQPVIVGIQHYRPPTSPTGTGSLSGHALVAYAYESSGARVSVKVYDCNRPKSDGCAIVFDTGENAWWYFRGPTSDPAIWSYGDGGREYDPGPAFTPSWPKLPPETIAALGGSCLIGFSPVQTVLVSGVPPWNPTRVVQEGFASAETVAESSFVSVSGIAAQSAVADGGSLIWTGPLGVNPEASTTPSAHATYVGTKLGSLRATLDATSSVPGAASIYSVGEFVSVTTSAAQPIGATISPHGSASVVTSATSPTTFSYAASRETSDSSHAFEITGASVERDGDDGIEPSPDFRTLDYVNGGKASTYSVAVRSIGASTREYGASDLKIGARDRHVASVSSWDNFDKSPPVVLVDRGNDGSIDETIALRPIDGPAPSDGAGGVGIVLGLGAIIGLIGGVVWLNRPRGESIAPEARSESWDWVNPSPAGAAAEVPLSPQGEAAISFAGGTRTLDSSRTYVIGREARSDMALSDPKVSGRHARLSSRLEDGQAIWWVEDLGSANGVFLNNNRIRGEARLSSGDTIRLGDSEMRFLGDG